MRKDASCKKIQNFDFILTFCDILVKLKGDFKHKDIDE